MTTKETLRETRDRLGWKSPWHNHYRIIRNGIDAPHDPHCPPIYAINCEASKCEAEGCSRTESGFPDG